MQLLQNKPPELNYPSASTKPDTRPVWLYFGKVMHARLKPAAHRFSYKVFSILLDIDRLEETSSISRIFSVNQPNVISFQEKDHGRRDGSDLRSFVEELLSKQDLEKPRKIMLWCNPRILGYTFNPLSIYFCYNHSGEICALIYQVHNTFGESHCYVAPAGFQPGEDASIRQSAAKNFYVSPFLDMDLRYDFRINPPDNKLRIRILEHDRAGPVLSASFSGSRKLFSTKNLFLGILQTAGLTWKITAGIHFEALKLWLKGIRLRPRPAPPVEASYVNTQGDG